MATELPQTRSSKPVAVWLLIGVFMIIVQVLLGGITRLTGSGLSITEWKPIIGALPPMNEQDWISAFEKYKQIAQYKYLNSHFALDDFKVENGATLYIPYSFHARAFPNNIEVEKIEPMKLSKGSLLFFRGDLWHSQGINTTDNPRVAVLANFSPLEIPAKDNMVQQLEQNKNLETVKIENGKVLLLDDS